MHLKCEQMNLLKLFANGKTLGYLWQKAPPLRGFFRCAPGMACIVCGRCLLAVVVKSDLEVKVLRTPAGGSASQEQG